jgi:hypothetical protein
MWGKSDNEVISVKCMFNPEFVVTSEQGTVPKIGPVPSIPPKW